MVSLLGYNFVGEDSFFLTSLLLLTEDPNPIEGLALLELREPKFIGLFLRVPSFDLIRYLALLEPASREWSLSWGGK